MKQKSVLGVVFSKFAGLLFFLLLLGLLSMVSSTNIIFNAIVDFFYSSLGIIIMFSVLFFFAELFEVFVFPFNLIYPLFNGFGSIFLIEFIFRLFSIVPIFYPLSLLQLLLTPLVFVIVLLVGYIKIIICFAPEKKPRPKKKPKKKKEKVDWKKKWNEFVEALNEFFIKVREIFTEEKKKR
ncbi:hypothetical protein GOV08_04660 [Candidatus Woesearchaeota archaeon]|nr:hypothetical protein [Candidatus Woesearchaeota archaeon]